MSETSGVEGKGILENSRDERNCTESAVFITPANICMGLVMLYLTEVILENEMI